MLEKPTSCIFFISCYISHGTTTRNFLIIASLSFMDSRSLMNRSVASLTVIPATGLLTSHSLTSLPAASQFRKSRAFRILTPRSVPSTEIGQAQERCFRPFEKCLQVDRWRQKIVSIKPREDGHRT